ncbi:surface lipoprotein assembly modifier [Moraxella marmotae]|uniref:surface lipoprotein assembly modifier n=1 Tax=Moraxella marmotae TaxID=3344520 RepID=UPI0035F2AFE9
MKLDLLSLCVLPIACGSLHAIAAPAPQLPPKAAEPKLYDESITIPEPPSITADTATQPVLDIAQAVQVATLTKNYQQLTQYLPEYAARADADPISVAYAQAVLATGQGRTKDAIAIYRRIIAEHPALTPIRFELAQVLYDDKQTIAARDQFIKVLSDNPPAFVQQVSDVYLQAIAKNARPQVDFSLNYINEDNINNANTSPNLGDSPFSKGQEMYPKSDTGLSYGLSVSHDYNVMNNHYLAMGVDGYGKYYFHEKDYNDALVRLNTGYVYKDEKRRFGLLPFYEHRWYGNDSYQHNAGIRAEYSNRISPKWQLSGAAEYAKQSYERHSDFDGYTALVSASALYVQNPKRYFYAGFDVNDDKTAERYNASRTHRLRFGMAQEFLGGVSGRLNLSIGERTFKDKAVIGGIIPLDMVRHDVEYGATLTAWKRNWHWYGITPKLSHSYRKVDSNIPSVYSYDRHQTFVLFEKTF